MNLPVIISTLVKAQNNYDSLGYADCFTAEATLFDEGKTHQGKTEIKAWVEQTNAQYRVVMKPINYSANDHAGQLTVEISGTFEGSPIVFTYHFELADGLIQSLKITS